MSFEDLDFECPQFVDFENLDAEEDDTFFDRLSERHNSENEFQRQIPAVVSRTPLHVRVDKGNSSRHQERNLRNITDSEKRKVVSHRRISKSLNDLSQVCNVKEPNLKGKRLQKRSASEDDLKSKKRINPITPTCLKRTIEKGKSKKILSTEERELVKIAEMRKQMADHLKLNKAAMKKICQKQYHPTVVAGPSGLAKPPPHFANRAQTKNAAANFTLDKKLTAAKKEPRKFDPPKPRMVKDDAKPVCSREKLKSSVKELANLSRSVFNASKSSAETTSDSDLFKIPEARGVGHGGMKFVGNKKKTVPMPFNFALETRLNSDNKTPRHSKHGNENLFKVADANTQEKLKEMKTAVRRSDKPTCSKMLDHSDEETTGNAGPSKVLKEKNVLKTHEKVERRARPKSEYTFRKQRPQFDFSTLKPKPLKGRSDSESTAE